MNEISKTLSLMCDKSDVQDKKLLLLAELVETRCDNLAQNQDVLKKSLDETNNKLDNLTRLLENFEASEKRCPVYRNKEDFENITFLLRHPRITMYACIGIIILAVMCVILPNITSVIKFFM